MTARVRLRATRAPAETLDTSVRPPEDVLAWENPTPEGGSPSGPGPVRFRHRSESRTRNDVSSDRRTRGSRPAGARRVARPHGRTDRRRNVELGGPRVRRGVV